ncbi:MAG: serine/threonine protein kinase [Planctomycetia bacterium]|nr:serine/threonine protein kinase [Planctomycetia bacterium]
MLITLATAACARAPRGAGPFDAWTAALRALPGGEATPARVRELLRGIPEGQRVEAAEDLITAAVRIAWSRGRAPLLAEWIAAACPGLPASACLVEAEFAARHQEPHGDAPADPGRVLAGRFVLLRRLGRGATGSGWEARDLAAGRLVAVKRPAGPEGAALLEQEARTTAGLDHPGVIAVRETGEGGGYGVMALADGPTLECGIREARATGGDQVSLVPALLDACEAVAHAHARGVTHGDLKAAHLVFGGAVLDWGLARREGDCDGAVEGTPETMAPEQARGERTARSDVFSLGAVLHELLTGRPARQWPKGVRPADWAGRVSNLPVQPASPLPGVPRSWGRACARALSHDPAVRQPHAGALAEDIVGRQGRQGRGLAALVRRALGLRHAGQGVYL